jgi:hypothetical protein
MESRADAWIAELRERIEASLFLAFVALGRMAGVEATTN